MLREWYGGRMIRTLIILLLGVFGPLSSVTAQPVQSLESIQEAVQQFLLDETAMQPGQIEIQVGRIDSRLRLAECELPPEAFWPDGGGRLGNITVGLRCISPSWSLFIRAKVEMHEAVLVTSRSLSRGASISQDDVSLQSQDVAALNRGYYTDPKEIMGGVLTRSVRAGTVLTPSLVKAAAVVKRGQRVNIMAATGSIQVRMEGEALSDGAVGEIIRVRNLSSRQEIDAMVVGQGLVQVRM